MQMWQYRSTLRIAPLIAAIALGVALLTRFFAYTPPGADVRPRPELEAGAPASLFERSPDQGPSAGGDASPTLSAPALPNEILFSFQPSRGPAASYAKNEREDQDRLVF